MSKFIQVDDTLVHVDHIVRVQLHQDGMIRLCLDDGKMIETEENCESILNAITGRRR